MSVAQMVVIWSLNVDFMYTSPKQAFLQNIENASKIFSLLCANTMIYALFCGRV